MLVRLMLSSLNTVTFIVIKVSLIFLSNTDMLLRARSRVRYAAKHIERQSMVQMRAIPQALPKIMSLLGICEVLKLAAELTLVDSQTAATRVC